MGEQAVTSVAAIVAAGIFCQWLAWRVRLPAIIFLLAAGVFAGPVLGLLQPDALFGPVLFPFVSLSVAIILFEGSLTLRFDQIAGLRQVVRNMVSVGMLVTWGITAVAVRLIMDWPWNLSLLFGAITVVSGPTVIVPILRIVRPKAAIANILRWEGITIDPIGATLAVLVFEFILAGSGENALTHTLTAFGRMVLVGILVGAVGGWLLGVLLRRHWVPEFLHNVTALAFALAAFGLSNHISAESGLLAVTVMGIWLANMPGVPIDDILNFKESLSVLLISLLFIVLAARIDLVALQPVVGRMLAVLAVMQLLARPLAVHISAFGSSLGLPEKHMLSWLYPRGIVAAAVAALFAFKLEALGLAEAGLLVPMTFSVIIGTVLLQGATAGLVARALGVADPDPKGLLLIGAGPVSRELGAVLKKQGFRVVLADMNWEALSKARIEGFETYFGNPVSEHADRHLDLVGLGRLLALSPNDQLNALCCVHYRMEFGRQNVYCLPVSGEATGSAKKKLAERQRGQVLFGADVTYARLATAVAKGGEIRATRLTENFGYADYLGRSDEQVLPLMSIGPKGHLHIWTAEAAAKPEAGWLMIGLAAPLENSQESA